MIKQYSNLTELTAELLNTLIEKIVVHEAVKSPDGCRKQKVDTTIALSERLIKRNSLRVGMRYAGETITLTMGVGCMLPGCGAATDDCELNMRSTTPVM